MVTERPTYPIRIDPATGCWNWEWYIERGYGRLGGRLAHRLVWEQKVGPVPEGKELDHLCRNTRCCNPRHLEAVTHAENSRRGAATKLSMEIAREIRASSETKVALAKKYSVHPHTIYLIRSHKTWREDV